MSNILKVWYDVKICKFKKCQWLNLSNIFCDTNTEAIRLISKQIDAERGNAG